MLLNWIPDRETSTVSVKPEPAGLLRLGVLIRPGPHQVEVPVLRRSIFGRHLLDVSFLDELIGRVDDVLLTSQSLVDLQQLVHFLLWGGNM